MDFLRETIRSFTPKPAATHWSDGSGTGEVARRLTQMGGGSVAP